jgi:hypothetical protein
VIENLSAGYFDCIAVPSEPWQSKAIKGGPYSIAFMPPVEECWGGARQVSLCSRTIKSRISASADHFFRCEFTDRAKAEPTVHSAAFEVAPRWVREICLINGLVPSLIASSRDTDCGRGTEKIGKLLRNHRV